VRGGLGSRTGASPDGPYLTKSVLRAVPAVGENAPQANCTRPAFRKLLRRKARRVRLRRPVNCTLPRMDSVELLDCARLKPGSIVEVETRSRHYRIECLGGHAVRVSGHPDYCPAPVDAELEGSLTRDGALESGLIECGQRLLLLLNQRLPITTSKVVHVRVENSPAAPTSQN